MKGKRYLIGVLSMVTSRPKTSNPITIRNAIIRGKALRLDMLIGPEWSLCSSSATRCKSNKESTHDKVLSRLASKGWVETSNSDHEKNVHNTAPLLRSRTFSARDANDLYRQMHNTRHYRELPEDVPYSPREAVRVINALRNATKGSDMVVMPGTMMIYTNSGRLYNVMPVVSNGKLIYSVLKYNDGGSSLFNLGGILKFMHGRSHGYTFKHDGIQFGIEICADSCSLARTTSQNGSKGLDIQILSSCGDRYTISALRRGGYFICSDGTGDGYTRVETSNRKPISPSLVDDDNLIVYSTSMLLHRRREETRRKDRET